MSLYSQLIDDKHAKRLGLDVDDAKMRDETVISMRMGKMFDDILSEDRKIPLSTRIGWKWREIKDFYYDVKYSIRNHVKWHKAMKQIRPWEGFNGLITVMQTHLRHYADCEEKYGISEENFKKNKIATARETVELLERMRDPMDYSSRLTDAVDAKFPDYLELITEHPHSTSCSGRFIAQGDGWVGRESGKDPREGYFELSDNKFELTASPDQAETDRLLAQLDSYIAEKNNAYEQAIIDEAQDFDRLAQIFKENFYTWWD